ncbi:MAG TPA: hypothetical protein VGX96_06660 [Candidatus Elarobacter sp.]|jgi:hypothetical protein|nr:hypothetical protein [Candidatus Elarobacter sp.]
MSYSSEHQGAGATAPVSYAKQIRPLFNNTDISHMAQHGIHLDQYASCKSNAQDIYGRLSQPPHSPKLMPPAPEGPWPKKNIDLFNQWIQGGCQP